MLVAKVRIRGTINDEVEVEYEPGMTDDEIREKARMEWMYVEYEDLVADDDVERDENEGSEDDDD
jgi:hypothetical protein